MNKLNIPETIVSINPRTIKIPNVETYVQFNQEEILNLSESIIASGIKRHPVIKESREVVFGRKRIIAAIYAQLEFIEVKVIRSDLEDFEYEVLSILDTLSKPNPKWTDKCILQARLHDLCKNNLPKHVLKHSAEMLACSIALLSENVIIATAIEKNKDLYNLPDRASALKAILFANRRNSQENNSVQFSIDSQVLHGDILEVLRLFNDKQFDVCISNIDGIVSAPLGEIYRVMKLNSFIYLFTTRPDDIMFKLKDHGFYTQKFPLIWIKEGLPQPERTWQYSNNYETIVFGVKGSPALLSDRINPCNYGSKKEIIKVLLSNSCHAESNILNPYAEDELVGVVCSQSNRNYTLIQSDFDLFGEIQRKLL